MRATDLASSMERNDVKPGRWIRIALPLVATAVLAGACAVAGSADEEEETAEGAASSKKSCDEPRGHVEIRPHLDGTFGVEFCDDACSGLGVFTEESFEDPSSPLCRVPERITTYLPKIVSAWKSHRGAKLVRIDGPKIDPATCSEVRELRACLATLPKAAVTPARDAGI
jgi:hypothetical protein